MELLSARAAGDDEAGILELTEVLGGAVARMGAEDGRVSDIFLPMWFADRIPWLCTPPLLVGVAGLIVRRRR